jgi:cholesterol transport system auxiliary component
MRLVALLGASALSCAGCALASKSTPAEVHWFSPEAIDAVHPTAAALPEPGAGRVRIGRVAASSHLRSRIVFREAAYELGAYDDRRWTENPDVYLRRALEHALFEERGVVQGLGGPVPVLDVELIAFEEVRRGGARTSGRVEVAYVLHDDRDVLAKGRVAVERPASSGAMGDVVAAIAAALEGATSEVAGAVAQRVSTAR